MDGYLECLAGVFLPADTLNLVASLRPVPGLAELCSSVYLLFDLFIVLLCFDRTGSAREECDRFIIGL